jgi:WhiB family redox-sensing transcriptional regulator
MPRPSRYAPDNLPRPPHWDEHAVCREPDVDPDLFFPDDEDEGLAVLLTQEAKAYCRRCPVAHPCAMSALDRGEPFGVWGGLDPDERRELLARAAALAAAVKEEEVPGVPAAA